jgi:hypothetical protein
MRGRRGDQQKKSHNNHEECCLCVCQMFAKNIKHFFLPQKFICASTRNVLKRVVYVDLIYEFAQLNAQLKVAIKSSSIINFIFIF